jgi:hypothetical protein
MCPMTLCGPWTVEIKKGLAVIACNKAHVFPRHALTLLRRLQDVGTYDVFMTYKSCIQAR